MRMTIQMQRWEGAGAVKGCDGVDVRGRARAIAPTPNWMRMMMMMTRMT